MDELRKFLSWIFAITSLISFRIALLDILPATHRQDAVLPFLRMRLIAALILIVAIVFGMAWWTIWKEKPSARGWGIAASVIYILPPLAAIVYSPYSIWRHLVVILVLRVAGLVAFSRRYEPPGSKAREHLRVPGDGTTDFVNRMANVLSVAVVLAAGFWCTRWIRAKGVSESHTGWPDAVLVVMVALTIVVLHELGHTATGLALGMKLRAFVVGPLQWCIRGGKWEFQFKLEGILGGGATGVVPTMADFPRWRHLCMVAAGPLVTLLTGVCALSIAFRLPANSPVQAGGFLALFGTWSLAVCLSNLLPFRTNNVYSDGAVLYQLFSGGPWADYYQIVSVVGSRLVTPLRPRDYDIEAIQQASRKESEEYCCDCMPTRTFSTTGGFSRPGKL